MGTRETSKNSFEQYNEKRNYRCGAEVIRIFGINSAFFVQINKKRAESGILVIENKVRVSPFL